MPSDVAAEAAADAADAAANGAANAHADGAADAAANIAAGADAAADAPPTAHAKTDHLDASRTSRSSRSTTCATIGERIHFLRAMPFRTALARVGHCTRFHVSPTT